MSSCRSGGLYMMNVSINKKPIYGFTTLAKRKDY